MVDTFTPSKYQEAIFDWVQHGAGNLVISATAGSGKTKTLELICHLLIEKAIAPDNILSLAFNKDIVTELNKRLNVLGIQAQTLNSLGHRALSKHLKRYPTLENRKYNDLAYEYLNNLGIPNKQMADTLREVRALIAFAMSSMSDLSDESLYALLDHYGIDVPNALNDTDMFNLVRHVLSVGERLAREKGIIAYDDQIYLPVKWGVRMPQYQYVLLDESQDVSASKLELTLMTQNANTRFIFCGDKNQSVYGFSGSDCDSMDKIIERTKAKTLNLSICYRCPKAVVREAQKIVSDIEFAPNAPEGIVRTIMDTELLTQLRDGDMVLCRINKPLVQLTLKLIGSGIKAKMRGRNFSQTLTRLAKEAMGKHGIWSDFVNLLTAHYIKKRHTLEARKAAESQVESLTDQIESVRVCYDNFNATSLEDFNQQLENLFADETHEGITLSSSHRAKGMQNPRVFVIKPEKLPLKFKNQQPWERVQESNLLFVTITRAMEELVWVKTTDEEDKK